MAVLVLPLVLVSLCRHVSYRHKYSTRANRSSVTYLPPAISWGQRDHATRADKRINTQHY